MFRKIKYIKVLILTLTFGLIVFGHTEYCFSKNYPQSISPISKDAANYLSPENTFAAKISALLYRDLDWYYETLTFDTAEKDKAFFEDAGIDPERNFDLIDESDRFYILDKKEYKNGILLLIESKKTDGRILRGPSILVRENNLWKTSTEFSADEELHVYLEVIESPPFNASIYPSQWPLPWYLWIAEQIEHNSWAEQIADSMTTLCVISDQEEDAFTVSDILPETLRLNDTIVPQPWRYFSWRTFSWEEKDTILFPATNHPIVSGRIFEQWREQLPLSNNEGQRMMVRFNLYQALQTLPDMEAGETYELTLSGMLEGDKPFKTTADISIINSFQQPESDWRWWRQNPPHHSELFENWWNR